MSDTIDESGIDVKRLLNRSKTRSLREQMRTFVDEHGEHTGFKELRETAANGTDVSTIVIDEREERV